jgi:hypothetical protein
LLIELLGLLQHLHGLVGTRHLGGRSRRIIVSRGRWLRGGAGSRWCCQRGSGTLLRSCHGLFEVSNLLGARTSNGRADKEC